MCDVLKRKPVESENSFLFLSFCLVPVLHTSQEINKWKLQREVIFVLTQMPMSRLTTAIADKAIRHASAAA